MILKFLRYFALAVACPADKVFQIHRLVHHPLAIVELNANVLELLNLEECSKRGFRSGLSEEAIYVVESPHGEVLGLGGESDCVSRLP